MALFGKKKNNGARAERTPDRNRYQPLRKLGEGGIAEVSGVFDTALNRVIAAKELKSDSAENPDLLQAFTREAKLITYLDHPGVVSVFDTFIAGSGRPCYTMKMVEGKTLSSLLIDEATGKAAALPTPRCLEIFTKMCETLAYAHDRGVIHLDLKPDNVMLGRYGEVLIMDWGSARIFDDRPYRDHIGRFINEPDLLSLQKESEGIILGTPEYMSPEQFRVERSQCLPSSDVFSAGIILYQMLTARHPFEGPNLSTVQEKINLFKPAPAQEVNPDVPRRLSQICGKMMEKELCNRFRNCREVLNELEHFNNSGEAFSNRSYAAGETIFEEGESGEYAFFIVSGRVEIAKTHGQGRKVLAVLGKNEFVGELAIFTGGPRTASARAVEPTVIRIMTRHDVARELDKLSPWVGRIITGLSHRFIKLNEKLLEELP